ncbi:MAG: 23S rRNA (uracil(1939)-C(5))-methyltransferase RlmD [Elusimicrobia bacterium]|nr:23S rRNA (uracil(1939)-C(5))-methyltransferase RlmD [Elusimicrobiota bacterium]
MKRPFQRGRPRPRVERGPATTATVKIERMAPEGQGLGRTEAGGGPGKVAFVAYGVPGDVVEARLESVKPGYAVGMLSRVLSAGPGRVEPPCPYHFRAGLERWCGGCDWQHLSDEAQREAKRSIVLDCLRRLGRIPDPPVEPVLPSPARWRYRNKVQVPFGVQGGRVIAGFYAPGSHRIVDFDDCVVQPELSVRVVRKVKALAESYRWRVYDEKAHQGWLRHLLVRVSQDGRAHAIVVSRTPDFPQRERFVSAMREAFPELAGLHHNVQREATSVVLGPGWRRLWGDEHLEERVGRLRLRASPGAFLQVNTPACERLYAAAESQLTANGFAPQLAVDLYCGVGAIALWVAPRVRRILGVEENRQAVQDAWENARANGVSNARFVAGRAETLLGRLREELGRAAPGSAAVLLDPPRSGVAPAVLNALGSPSVRRIVYVSCNPATFARDAACLGRSGFRLSIVQPVDLFPQTSHIELSALLERAR